jgi:hypothetical protein
MSNRAVGGGAIYYLGPAATMPLSLMLMPVTASLRFTYEGRELERSARLLSLVSSYGYIWRYRHGGFLTLGGGLQYTQVLSSNASGELTDAELAKLSASEQQLLGGDAFQTGLSPSGNFLIGYAF